VTLQVVDGHSDWLFDAQKRSDLAYNAHYRVFADLSESTNADFGLSYGQGPGTASTSTRTNWTQLEGGDLTLRWKPLAHGNYRSASLRAEVIRSLRDQPDSLGGKQTAVGWFVSGEYQLANAGWSEPALKARTCRRLQDERQRPGRDAHVLAERVFPAPQRAPAAPLRRRHYGD
jgi:hypothetical protein